MSAAPRDFEPALGGAEGSVAVCVNQERRKGETPDVHAGHTTTRQIQLQPLLILPHEGLARFSFCWAASLRPRVQWLLVIFGKLSPSQQQTAHRYSSTLTFLSYHGLLPGPG